MVRSTIADVLTKPQPVAGDDKSAESKGK